MSGDADFQNKHRTEWQEFLWDRFLNKIIQAKSKEQARKVLDKFFSAYEKELVAKRLAALALIREGKNYREIGRVLWLSPATISALKKNVLSGSSAYKSQRSHKTIGSVHSGSRVKALVKKSWLEELFGDIDLWELIKNPPRPSGTGIRAAIRDGDALEYRRKTK